MSGNLGSSLGDFGKSIFKNSILDLGVASGAAIGAAVDYAIGFSDGGVLIGLGVDIGKKISTDMGNILTEDNNASPDRVRYFGDPISAMDFNAKTLFPSFKQRWNNSAHSYPGFLLRMQCDVGRNPLTQSPDDNKAEVFTE